MPTITIRLPKGLKSRVAATAEAWTHEPAMRDQLRRADEWAKRTPPAATKLEKLVGSAAKRAGKSGGPEGAGST